MFELGRRYGFQGRLYAHAVVVANDLFVAGSSIGAGPSFPRKGTRCCPRVEAFLLQTAHPRAEAIALNLAARLIPRMS